MIRRLGTALLALAILSAPAAAQSDTDDEVVEAASEHSSGRDPDPDYVRPFVLELVFLLAGTVWYWVDRDKNAVDWDFDSWTQRFDRSAFRYDNNAFSVNWTFHPLSGSAYYGFARANDLHPGWSFTYAFLTSFAWEWLLEFKERVSINDQIATPVGGMVLGEFFYKVSRFLHVNATTRARRAAAWSLGLGVQANEAIDGHRPTQAERDALHARFHLGYGGALLSAGGERAGLHTVDFEGRIVEMPGWHEPRELRRAFGNANVTRLRARATRGPGGGGFELDGDTIVTGLHVQSLDESGGGSALVGAALGYSYRRVDYEDFSDAVGAVHLPGFALDTMLRRPSAELRFLFRAHPDFASADATLAYDAWALDHPDARAKTILEREGYFYGWGATTWAELELELGPVELGMRASFSRWLSDEGLDRSQEVVTDDVEVESRRVSMSSWARVQLPRSVHLELRYDELRRWDWVGGYGERGRLRRVGLSVGVTR
ncbi:MAG: DUF3943 domain-containing protein [Deltaproteobacteria bacterium]|nr:DUF3943 domain-containing protein [Deltaproteobacteria bacterium]